MYVPACACHSRIVAQHALGRQIVDAVCRHYHLEAVRALLDARFRGVVDAAPPVWGHPEPAFASTAGCRGTKFVLVRSSTELDLNQLIEAMVRQQYANTVRQSHLGLPHPSVLTGFLVHCAKGLSNVSMARAVVWPVSHNPGFNPDDPAPRMDPCNNGMRADAVANHWALLVADIEARCFMWVDSLDPDATAEFNGAARGAVCLASS